MNYSILFAVLFAYAFVVCKNLYNLTRIKKLKKQYIDFKTKNHPLPKSFQSECRILFWLADVNRLVKVAHNDSIDNVLNNFPKSQTDSLCRNCFDAAISQFAYNLKCTYSLFAFVNRLMYVFCNFDIRTLDRLEALLRFAISCAGMIASAFVGSELHELFALLFNSVDAT